MGGPLFWVLGLSAAFFLLFVVVSGAMFLKGGSGSSGGKKHVSLFGGGVVGVIELNGVIMDSKKILGRLEDFEDDDRVKAVVLRLNSPGGSVAPSQEIYEAVRAFKKPLVVSMGSVAASGAFYIACGAKKVFANPGTITGSIGVIMEFINLEKLYDWAKVKRYAIKTGKFKDAGAEFREMTAEEKELLQGMVNDVLTQFKEAISKGRKLSMEQVTAIADGRIFSGTQAKARKLVDELGTLQDAINEAGKQAKLSGKPDVVYPSGGKRKLLEMLMDDGNRDEDRSESTSDSVVSRVMGALGGAFGRVGSAVSRQETPALEPGIYWLWSGIH
jgi:protease-4